MRLESSQKTQTAVSLCLLEGMRQARQDQGIAKGTRAQSEEWCHRLMITRGTTVRGNAGRSEATGISSREEEIGGAEQLRGTQRRSEKATNRDVRKEIEGLL